ncbi:hypothetical protein SOVF_025170 [Spinacia oleracea]|nr:hypothetical protein SOVF_025170 [Spinacia oleracea]
MDLNLMMKRGKLAGKALGNHFFAASQGGGDGVGGPPFNLPNEAAGEYEFSCSNTPSYRHYFTNKRKNHRHPNNNNDLDLWDENVNLEDVSNMLDMILGGGVSAAASPALPGLGFGRSPAVRQLRVTDSPFPVRDMDQDYNKHVDQAAEDFIKKFYTQLKQQN